MAPVQNEKDTNESGDERHGPDRFSTTSLDQYGTAPSDPLLIPFEGGSNVMVSSAGSSNRGGQQQQQQRDHNVRRRAPFVSRHRKALNHISSDSLKARRHSVPAYPLGMPLTHGIAEETSLCGRWTASCRETVADKSLDDWAGTFLPMYSWLKGYPWRTSAAQDLVAGLTGKWEKEAVKILLLG